VATHSYEDATRRRFLDFWTRSESFGAPIGCLATTYTFSSEFFEKECLGRFAGMETDPNENSRAYILEREEKFSQLFAGVFVDRANVSAFRSLRWHQVPVRAMGGGILHAKVTLIAWENLIRILIGSANLTPWGYRRNFENLVSIDFSPRDGAPLGLLREILTFLRDLAAAAPRSQTTEVGPVAATRRFLETVTRRIAKWDEGAFASGEPRLSLVVTGPGRPPLFEFLSKNVWQGPGPLSVQIVSPFFDEGPSAPAVLKSLAQVMGVHGERSIDFVARGIRNADRTVDLQVPEAYRTPEAGRFRHTFAIVPSHDSENNERPLHSKCLWMERGEQAALVLGSSNFTSAGTGIARAPNIEANVVFTFPSGAFRARNKYGSCLPPAEVLDLDVDDVRFVGVAPDSSETGPYALLPSRFRDALFEPGASGRGVPRLTLSIDEGEPSVFSILTLEGERVAESEGMPRTVEAHSIDWNRPRPPSALLVRWMEPVNGKREALWVVNVSDTSRLPPPDELRDLSLDVLVEVLSSARPMHEAIAKALDDRSNYGSGAIPIELDPHKKVDTSGFLLKRVQRVSRALEGLRERLERPAYTLDGLQWRLFGPIGPQALARQLHAGNDAVAPFLIGELALTLGRVDWSETERLLGRSEVRRVVESVVADLRELSASGSQRSALGDYVNSCFDEVSK
jgi:PLD-like domain